MYGGTPDDPENYAPVDTGEMKVYVPNDGVFSGDIPRLVVFPRRNGARSVGVVRLD